MDLKTKYMGLELKNPFIASASPLSQSVDGIQKLRDAGASAVVMFSLFEEQLKQEAEALDYFKTAGTESFAEALSYFPEVGDFSFGPGQYLDLIHQAAQKVDIPIIGSLNGVSNQGWIDYAKKMVEAGARGIELNVYYIPTNPKMSGSQVEKMYLNVVKSVAASVEVPVAVKIGPFFSSMANMARKLVRAGADALVLFNRFYQPDFDLEEMEVASTLDLSTSMEMRLPLRWIAILRDLLPRKTSIAATTGVQTGTDAAKYILAGADAVMTASALLKNGPGHLGALLSELEDWMAKKEYTSVKQMKGAMSQKAVANPTAFERANYIKILENYKSQYAS